MVAFFSLNETFPNISEVEIWTDQDIPNAHTVNDTLRGLFNYFLYDPEGNGGNGAWVSYGVSWIKIFSAKNIKCVGNATFTGAKSLTTINIPSVQVIRPYAFQGTGLISLELPALTTLEHFAFAECENLISVDLPLATIIEGWAFAGCSSLLTLNSHTITTIEGGAFYGCSSLTTVYLPLATTIGGMSFYECNNLMTVEFGRDFAEPTEIILRGAVDSDKTPSINLYLSSNTLPLPNLPANIWNRSEVFPNGVAYVWKSITIYVDVEEELVKNMFVNIFPNPTSDIATLNIEIEKNCNLEISLFDVLGNQIKSIYNGFASEGLFTKTVRLSDVSKGVYYLQIASEKFVRIERIIVN